MVSDMHDMFVAGPQELGSPPRVGPPGMSGDDAVAAMFVASNTT
jgi:hypothetical protein